MLFGVFKLEKALFNRVRNQGWYNHRNTTSDFIPRFHQPKPPIHQLAPDFPFHFSYV